MYENVEFPTLADRPYFYTNFVSTLDGKAEVVGRHDEYWPIGSPADREAFINLRVPADVLIHGRLTAMMHDTVKSLASPEFQAARAARGKTRELSYVILSENPDGALEKHIQNTDGIHPVIMGGADLPALGRDLKQKGISAALVEGGPHLMASFFAAGLIDEIFLTLAPKVFGGGGVDTLTMVEGKMLPPGRVSGWKLVSAIPLEDEVFLRYRK